MSRPRIIIDLDNVLYNWAEHMAILIAEYVQPNMSPEELMAQHRTWEIWADWQLPKGLFDLVWERAIESGDMYARMGIQAEALRSLWQLSDAEWHIHIVTSRLNKFRLYDQSVKNTVAWLERYGIPYRSLSFEEEKQHIYADAIVDDKPANLVGHPAPQRFLFPAYHNIEEDSTEEYRRLDDVAPWDDLVQSLT